MLKQEGVLEVLGGIFFLTLAAEYLFSVQKSAGRSIKFASMLAPFCVVLVSNEDAVTPGSLWRLSSFILSERVDTAKPPCQ